MRSLIRAAALCAIAGGALRIADSFAVAMLSASTLAILYFVTDVFLLAGVAGFWLRRRATLGVAATLGLAIFVCGILMVRASAFGVGSYQLGATVALLGLTAYSFETLLRRSAAPFAPLFWLISLAAGIAGAAGFMPESMTIAAGVAFGAGFVAAGIENLTV